MSDAPDPMKPNLAETTGPAVDIVETESAVERRAKEASFTASQSQLIWARFKKQRAAMVAATLLVLMILSAMGPERVVLAVVIACGILTYGGVSVFVVVFAIYPIAASLFRDADIPKRLTGEGPQIRLGYIGTFSQMYKAPDIHIRAVVEAREEQRLLLAGIESSLDQARIPAKVHILLKGEERFPVILRRESAGADIVFLGLKVTKEGEESTHAAKIEEMAGVAKTVVFVQNNSVQEALPILLQV